MIRLHVCLIKSGRKEKLISVLITPAGIRTLFEQPVANSYANYTLIFISYCILTWSQIMISTNKKQSYWAVPSEYRRLLLSSFSINSTFFMSSVCCTYKYSFIHSLFTFFLHHAFLYCYTTQTNDMHNFLNEYLISLVSCRFRTSWFHPRLEHSLLSSRLLTPMHIKHATLHI